MEALERKDSWRSNRFGRYGRGRELRGGTRRLSWRDVLTVLAVLAALTAGAVIVGRDQNEEIQGRARVSDGDSLVIDEQRIRLIGIDAPELKQTCRDVSGMVECGRSARFHLLGLVAGKRVTCTGMQYDRYDRLLAICVARNAVGPTSVGIELNAAMVRDGWAIAYGGYEAEEDEARRARRGVWALDFERPSDWRVETHLVRLERKPSLVSKWVQPVLTRLEAWLTSWFDG